MENNQENIPPVIQPQPPKQLNKKLVATLGLVVVGLVILVAIGGYFVWKGKQKSILPHIPVITASDIPNWQTYTNEKYGFEIQFPKNWKVALENEPMCEPEGCTGETAVALYPNIPTGGPNDTDSYSIDTGVRFSIDKNNVPCTSAYVWKSNVGTGTYTTTEKRVCVGNFWIDLVLFDDIPQKELYKQTLDQILSTFKFTDQKNQLTATSSKISISGDKKSIIADGKVLWVINDDHIFNFLKTAENQLCDEKDILNNPTNDHKMFCEQKSQFENKSTFSSIVVSQDGMKIGFTVAGEPSQPDTVVGIFYPSRTTNKIHFLTDYYLDNNFISFSPSGTYFVYKSGCWEGACAFYIANSETLENRKLNFIPEYADERGNYEFVRWISDNEIEYKLDGVLIHQLLSHTNTDTLPNSSQGEQCVPSSCWGHLGCNYYTCTNGTSTYTKFLN
jgi:hypothetical protein